MFVMPPVTSCKNPCCKFTSDIDRCLAPRFCVTFPSGILFSCKKFPNFLPIIAEFAAAVVYDGPVEFIKRVGSSRKFTGWERCFLCLEIRPGVTVGYGWNS